MNKSTLIISLVFVALFSTINILLLYKNYADYGLAELVSQLVSGLGSIPAFIMIFTRSNIRALIFTKVFAITTMLVSSNFMDVRMTPSYSFNDLCLILNCILLPVCIISIVLVVQNKRRSSNS